MTCTFKDLTASCNTWPALKMTLRWKRSHVLKPAESHNERVLWALSNKLPANPHLCACDSLYVFPFVHAEVFSPDVFSLHRMFMRAGQTASEPLSTPGLVVSAEWRYNQSVAGTHKRSHSPADRFVSSSHFTQATQTLSEKSHSVNHMIEAFTVTAFSHFPEKWHRCRGSAEELCSSFQCDQSSRWNERCALPKSTLCRWEEAMTMDSFPSGPCRFRVRTEKRWFGWKWGQQDSWGSGCHDGGCDNCSFQGNETQLFWSMENKFFLWVELCLWISSTEPTD